MLDIAALEADQPEKALRSFDAGRPKRILNCDVLIVGGGVGGVAAAQKIWSLVASKGEQLKSALGRSKPLQVIMTEETDWLGGQMTAQGVPALDENYLVETCGATLSYQRLRKAIRASYKSNAKLTSESSQDPYFNPGDCWVSYLAFEPKVGLEEINRLLTPALADGSLKVLYRSKPFRVNRTPRAGGEPRINSVDFVDFASGETFSVRPKICLDATELGDVVALAQFDYSVGSESRSLTGEAHAPEVGDSQNVQDFTYPFIVELRPGTNNCISKPHLFDEFQNAGKFSLLGYKMFASAEKPDGDYLPFWEYRRLIASSTFADDMRAYDIAVINWESNDLRGFNIIDQPPLLTAQHLARAKLVSLGFLYWLQHLAPRDDGGLGYPELMLRQDMLGTTDGLSKYPYIRESRRVKSRKTIVEQDIVAAFNDGARAQPFNDSLGIGFYPVDIHGRQEVSGAGQATKPFQIPLGSLIPLPGGNLLPACKNIGTTHITNGAYRLHPIEWAIGEAQGTLAAFALTSGIKPSDVFANLGKLRTLQKLLVETGVPIYWYEDVPTDCENFSAIQFLSAVDIMPGNHGDLRFNPDDQLSRFQLAQAIVKILFRDPAPSPQYRGTSDLPSHAPEGQAMQICVSEGLFKPGENADLNPGASVTSGDLQEIACTKFIDKKTRERLSLYLNSQESLRMPNAHVTRRQAAGWLYMLATSGRYFGSM